MSMFANEEMINEDWHEIFVPGRLCVLGEHSDWCAQYTLENPAVPYGATIVCATNEGLYTKCRKLPLLKGKDACMKIKSKTSNNENLEIEIELDVEKLIVAANTGGFFSYAFGTAAIMLKSIILSKFKKIDYSIEIINYETTLPMKKGLSSSAAVCVTIAKCFDILFDLHLDIKDIMEMSYQGESLTPSKCGRMDQCVAMGGDKIGLMEFDGNTCNLSILQCKTSLYFVVADLKAGKNTITILKSLNECFPYPSDETKAMMHQYVSNNHHLSWKAVEAIERGDIISLANAMNDAQEMFDKCAIENCPSELRSPKLHTVINHSNLRSVSLAIKGVGSQGDGSVQVLCATRDMQEKALQILQNELGCEGFLLTVPPSDAIIPKSLRCINRIRFAVVVVDPASLQSSFFADLSIYTSKPMKKKSWLNLLQELIASGIEKIAYIIPSNQNNHSSAVEAFSNLFEFTSKDWTYKDFQLELIKTRTHCFHQQPQESEFQTINRALDMFTNIENEKVLVCKAEVLPCNTADQGIKKIINIGSIGDETIPILVAINKVDREEELPSDRLYLESIKTHTVNGTLITSLQKITENKSKAIYFNEGFMVLNLYEAKKYLETTKSSTLYHPLDDLLNTIVESVEVSGLSLGSIITTVS